MLWGEGKRGGRSRECGQVCWGVGKCGDRCREVC